MDIHDRLKSAKRYRWVAIIAASILGLGTIFYHFVERLSWLDSWYFSTITLTTVGYGDIAPKTALGKLFTTFYVLFGVGIIGATLNILIRGAAERRIQRHRERQKNQNN